MITQPDQDRRAAQDISNGSDQVDHRTAMLADLIKAAMERGIDVPKIIANVLRQKKNAGEERVI